MVVFAGIFAQDVDSPVKVSVDFRENVGIKQTCSSATYIRRMTSFSRNGIPQIEICQYVDILYHIWAAVNTPRPSRGTRIESCDFIVLIGDP